MDDLELITRFRSHVEPPNARRVARARRTLAREFEPALSSPPPRARLRLRVAALVAAPAAALAAAVLLVTGVFGGSAAGIADAAIIRRVDAALTPPPNEIFHIAVIGDGLESQTWQLTSPPYSSLSYKGQVRGRKSEQASSGSTISWWDSATNTIHQQLAPTPQQPFDDPLAQVRSEVSVGRARVLGTATVDGKPTYEIQFASKDQFGRRDQFGAHSPVVYVDQTTYRPLVLLAPQHDGSMVRLHVTAFEYLRRTKANMRLLSLSARHPSARVVADRSNRPDTK
jgi:hypothetical protein